MAFHLRMRAHGIRDLALLRAFERVPRSAFVPPRYARHAARGLAVPIPCGQTMGEPWLVARMIEALRVSPGHRVLEIGSGTGYAAAVLAQIAGHVVGVERHADLAQTARMRLTKAGIDNAEISWDDGLALSPSDRAADRFDRILVHGRVDDLASLLPLLDKEGVLVCGRAGADGAVIARVALDNGAPLETPIGPASLRAMVPGVTGSL